MPYCPKCGVEYHYGVMNCADCHVMLSSSVADYIGGNGRLVTLIKLQNHLTARAVCDLLKGAGVPCVPRGTKVKKKKVAHSDIGLPAEVSVLVPPNRIKYARNLVNTYFEKTGQTKR